MNARATPDDVWLRLALERFHREPDQALRDEIADRTDWLATRLARRFIGRGEPFDDLLQVARIGLLKTIERFDPTMGIPFVGYATPTMLGELRRHFRDHTWSIHVSRTAKDLRGPLASAIDQLTNELGRAPLVPELARRMMISEDDVVEVIEVGQAYRSTELDPENPRHVSPSALTAPDDLDRNEVAALLGTLPQRERTILYLRYFEGLSQAAIADRLGTSQVHVGRLITASLLRLRSLGGRDDV
jgi:RNA polymerase sigma-B factor